MNFSLDEGQLALKDAVRKYCDGEISINDRALENNEEFQGKCWKGLAELGILGLTVNEEYGGSGLSLIDAVLVVEELGRAMISRHYIESILVCAKLIDKLGSIEQKKSVIPELSSGKRKCSLVLGEGFNNSSNGSLVIAKKVNDGWLLSGVKNRILDPGSDGYLLIIAQEFNEECESECLKGFIVEASKLSSCIRFGSMADGNRSIDIEFKNIIVKDSEIITLGKNGSVNLCAIKEQLNECQIAFSASSMGGLLVAFEQTVSYLKDRKQFGRRVIDFQVVQHSLANFYIALEQLRSTIHLAALTAVKGEAAEINRLVAALHVLTVDASYQFSELSIQLHGAMGMTEECLVGRYARILVASAQRMSRATHSLKTFGALSLPTTVGIKGGE